MRMWVFDKHEHSPTGEGEGSWHPLEHDLVRVVEQQSARSIAQSHVPPVHTPCTCPQGDGFLPSTQGSSSAEKSPDLSSSQLSTGPLRSVSAVAFATASTCRVSRCSARFTGTDRLAAWCRQYKATRFVNPSVPAAAAVFLPTLLEWLHRSYSASTRQSSPVAMRLRRCSAPILARLWRHIAETPPGLTG